MTDATTIVYEPAHGSHGRAASQLAEELASCMTARIVPATDEHGGRRRARRLALAAAREAASLIVVAVDEPWPVVASRIGRRSADVVRAAPCPVVLVPSLLADREPPLLTGDHILWAVADRCDSGCAPVVASLARGLDRPVTVAHVLPDVTDALTPADLMAGRLAGWFVDGLLSDLAEHDPQVEDHSTVRLSSGEPGSELRRLGDEEGAALAVVGCRGRGPMRAAALGPVSSHLARHGATPVVVCPPEAKQFRCDGLPESTAA
jgi:nucleotide-binding universal stress UspA family protein